MTEVDLREVLKELTALAGPSGFEGGASGRAMELLAPLVDEVYTDRLGSVIGLKRCGRPGAKKVLLDAHLDEVSLIVTGIEDGFLRFQTIGGVDLRMLPDREVTVLAPEPLFGVATCLPPHVQSAADHDTAAKLEALFVDVGLSQEEAEKRIPIGTPMTFRAGAFVLGEKRFCGKALDDRACFAALLRCGELLRDKPLDVDVYFVGSSREEVGGWGARCAGFSAAPDWCVAVDVTHGATPDAAKSGGGAVTELGEGPVVGIGPVTPRWMSELLEQTAGEGDIPYQREILPGLSDTNGDDYQIAREGIATAVLSLPLRYMHTPVETIDLDDLEHLSRLLAAFVIKLGKEGTPC